MPQNILGTARMVSTDKKWVKESYLNNLEFK